MDEQNQTESPPLPAQRSESGIYLLAAHPNWRDRLASDPAHWPEIDAFVVFQAVSGAHVLEPALASLLIGAVALSIDKFLLPRYARLANQPQGVRA